MIVVNKKQYLKELMTLTLINILNAKGAIYWHYKNKQKTKGKQNENIKNRSSRWIKWSGI